MLLHRGRLHIARLTDVFTQGLTHGRLVKGLRDRRSQCRCSPPSDTQLRYSPWWPWGGWCHWCPPRCRRTCQSWFHSYSGRRWSLHLQGALEERMWLSVLRVRTETPCSRWQNMLWLSKSPDDHLLSPSGSSLTGPLSSPAAHRIVIIDSHSHTSVHSLRFVTQTWIEGLFVFSTVTCNDRHSELLLTENFSQDEGLGDKPPPKPPLPPCSAS